MTPDHWLFSPEMQDVVQSRPIPFHIGGVSASSNTELSQLGGCTARIVPLARRKIVPSEDKIVVLVFRRYRRKEISIAPLYLIPWEPVVTYARRERGARGDR